LRVTPEIGARLKAHRDRAGLSQEILASEVGLDQSRISNIERGKASIPLPVLASICGLLGVSVEQVIPSDIVEVPFCEQIERAVDNTVKIHGVTYQTPTITRETGGHQYRPSSVTRRLRPAELARINEADDTNEMHGFVTRWERRHNTFAFRYTPADYATLRAERTLGNPVKPLYAGAFILSLERGGIWVHRRSDRVDVSPKALHTFSGNFIAGGRNADIDLLQTCRRELLEEAHVTIHVGDRVPVVLFEETKKPLFIFMWLGVHIQSEDSNRVRGSWEGESVFVSFDQLERYLLRDDWRSEGKAHVLTWLALDAPGSPATFREKAQGILHRVLKYNNVSRRRE
jgi:transcriptional regulator with XRE-family HTH domain